MVITHTPRLAEAYGVEDLVEQGGSEDGVVVPLGRHLETQKAILTEASKAATSLTTPLPGVRSRWNGSPKAMR